MANINNRFLTVSLLTGAVSAAGLLCGCHGPNGALFSYTGASQTLESSERSPKTFQLVDTRTDEVVFEIDVPVGKQFTWDFVEEGGDDPVMRQSVMRYEIFEKGTHLGRLRNAVTVPNAASRRVDWFIREAPEYAEAPPEYDMRVDSVEDRPDWWSPRGGAFDDSPKTTMYDD